MKEVLIEGVYHKERWKLFCCGHPLGQCFVEGKRCKDYRL